MKANSKTKLTKDKDIIDGVVTFEGGIDKEMQHLTDKDEGSTINPSYRQVQSPSTEMMNRTLDRSDGGSM